MFRAETARIDVTASRSRYYRYPGIVLHRVHEFHIAVEQAELLGLFDLRKLERLEARSPRRKGWPLLRAVLADYRDPAPTRSELERRFLEFCRQAGLPPPAVNSFVAGFEVDVVWHEARLVVELDGHAFHRTRAAFERDRRRDAALQLKGYRVLRVTHRWLGQEPEEVLATIRALLGPGTGQLDIAALDT